MPFTCKLRDGKFYVVIKSTGKRAKNAAGTPVHKKGYSSQAQCMKQAVAMNISEFK